MEDYSDLDLDQGPSTSGPSLITRHKFDDCLHQKDNVEAELKNNTKILHAPIDSGSDEKIYNPPKNASNEALVKNENNKSHCDSDSEDLSYKFQNNVFIELPSDNDNMHTDEEEDEELDTTIEMSEKSTDVKTFKIKQSVKVLKVKRRPKKIMEFEVSIKKAEFGDGLFYEGDRPIKEKTFFGPYTGEKFTSTKKWNERNKKMKYGKNDTPYAVHVCRDGHDVWYDPGNKPDGQTHPLAKINMAGKFADVNVIFQQFKDEMFLEVIKPITKGSEFLTCYGNGYGEQLGIDMENYYPEDCRYEHSARKMFQRRSLGK